MRCVDRSEVETHSHLTVLKLALARTPHPSGGRTPFLRNVVLPVSPASHLRCSNSAPRRPSVFSNSCPADSRSPERRSPNGDKRPAARREFEHRRTTFLQERSLSTGGARCAGHHGPLHGNMLEEKGRFQGQADPSTNPIGVGRKARKKSFNKAETTRSGPAANRPRTLCSTRSPGERGC